MDLTRNQNLKILSIFSFLAILSELFLLIEEGPASGYEISIYGAYPLIFWIFMITSLAVSVSVIFFSINTNSKYWIFSLLAVFINYSILLFLPFIRGYLFFGSYGYDMFAHIGDIIFILKNGHLPENLLYPLTLVLSAVLNLVGLPLRFTINFMCTFFSLIYILFFFLLGKAIFKNENKALLMLIFALPLMYSYLHQAFLPFFFALCFIPLFLYFMCKRDTENKLQFNLLTVILSFSVIYSHPLISFILAIILVIFQLYNWRYSSLVIRKGYTNLLNIIIITSVIWYLNFRSILKSIHNILNAIFDSSHNTIIESQFNSINSSNASFLTVVELFLKVHGPIFIYYSLAFCCLILLLKKINYQNLEYDRRVYAFQHVASMFLGLLLIGGYFIIFEPIRAASFGVITSTILCTIFFDYCLTKMNHTPKRKLLQSIVLIIICTSISLSIFNIYESPWRGIPSPHFSQMQGCGVDWMLESKNSSIPLLINSNSIYKYEIYFYSKNGVMIKDRTPLKGWIPSHFGYDTNNTLGESLNYESIYMVTNEFIRQFPSGVLLSERYKYPKYTPEDFESLDKDSTVNKIYVNGEFESWYM